MEFPCYIIELKSSRQKNLKRREFGSFQNRIRNKNVHIKKLKLEA